MHVYPSTLYGDTLAEAERVAVQAVRALGLRDGIAFPQLIAANGVASVVEVAARIPGGQMADLARHAVGVDLVEVAVLQALGLPVPERGGVAALLATARGALLHGRAGPLPTGKVVSFSGQERVEAFPGVVQVGLYLTVGETIRPVQVDGDRRGYVIAVADTNLEALERAEAAATLLDVEVE